MFCDGADRARTDAHRNSMTDLVKRAKSVKIQNNVLMHSKVPWWHYTTASLCCCSQTGTTAVTGNDFNELPSLSSWPKKTKSEWETVRLKDKTQSSCIRGGWRKSIMLSVRSTPSTGLEPYPYKEREETKMFINMWRPNTCVSKDFWSICAAL